MPRWVSVGVFVGAGAIGASLTSSLSGGKRNSVNSPSAQPEVQRLERQKRGVLTFCSVFTSHRISEVRQNRFPGRFREAARADRPAHAATRPPARGSRKLSVPTATSVAPLRSRSRASAPHCTPPIPTIGIPTRAATSRHLREGDRAHRRTGHAARPAAEPGRARARVQRHAAQRVDERDRVGARVLGGGRDRRRRPSRWA